MLVPWISLVKDAIFPEICENIIKNFSWDKNVEEITNALLNVNILFDIKRK